MSAVPVEGFTRKRVWPWALGWFVVGLLVGIRIGMEISFRY